MALRRQFVGNDFFLFASNLISFFAGGLRPIIMHEVTVTRTGSIIRTLYTRWFVGMVASACSAWHAGENEEEIAFDAIQAERMLCHSRSEITAAGSLRVRINCLCEWIRTPKTQWIKINLAEVRAKRIYSIFMCVVRAIWLPFVLVLVSRMCRVSQEVLNANESARAHPTMIIIIQTKRAWLLLDLKCGFAAATPWMCARKMETQFAEREHERRVRAFLSVKIPKATQKTSTPMTGWRRILQKASSRTEATKKYEKEARETSQRGFEILSTNCMPLCQRLCALFLARQEKPDHIRQRNTCTWGLEHFRVLSCPSVRMGASQTETDVRKNHQTKHK